MQNMFWKSENLSTDNYSQNWKKTNKGGENFHIFDKINIFSTCSWLYYVNIELIFMYQNMPLLKNM